MPTKADLCSCLDGRIALALALQRSRISSGGFCPVIVDRGLDINTDIEMVSFV